MNIRSTASASTSTFVWDPVPCGERRGEILGYLYELRYTAGTVDYGRVTETSVTIENLVPDSKYGFRVAARNSVGLGPFSDGIFSQTAPAEDPQTTSAVELGKKIFNFPLF